MIGKYTWIQEGVGGELGGARKSLSYKICDFTKKILCLLPCVFYYYYFYPRTMILSAV
jgi:hypothetical protein